MARGFESGEKLMYKYQTLLYFPYENEPGTSFLLTSNPWAFLKAWLDKQLSERGYRGDNKKRFERAKYFAEQAESFQVAAQKTQLPTKATLIYYSMLNLVKAYLSTSGLDLEIREEIHGVSLSQTDYELKIQGPGRNCTNIFFEFCKALGKSYSGKHSVNINEVISDIVEIHELSHSLGIISQRKFLPCEISLLTNKERTHMFSELSYKKENEVRFPTDKFLKNERKNYFKKKEPCDDGIVVFRSKRRKTYTQDNLPTKYKNICKDYKEMSIHLLLTRSRFKYYVNLIPNKYHQLANTLLLMYFMGTTARYRPTLTSEIMTGNLFPIFSEATETCPRQFLYAITSLITKNVCAVPLSKI